MADDIDLEIKKIQLEAAKIDLEAKRTDLTSRPRSLLLSAFSNPIVVAAAIAAIVTLSTAAISSIVAEHQKQLEEKKTEEQTKLTTWKDEAERKLEQLKAESAMILDVVRTGDPDKAATNLKFLVDVGLVPQTAPRLDEYLNNRQPGTGKVLPRPGENMPLNPPH